MQKNKTLEESILFLQKKAENGPISIEEIFRALPGKGQALILILLSFPFCQPIQIPGISIPFGLAIVFVALRTAFGRRAWLPKKILSRTIAAHTIEKIAVNFFLLTKKMKRWIHPRMRWMCHSPSMHVVNGLTISILGIFLALPLPVPFSNLTAAWSIFLIALGMLEDDGVFVLAGYLTSLLTGIFFIAMAFSIKYFF